MRKESKHRHNTRLHTIPGTKISLLRQRIQLAAFTGTDNIQAPIITSSGNLLSILQELRSGCPNPLDQLQRYPMGPTGCPKALV